MKFQSVDIGSEVWLNKAPSLFGKKLALHDIVVFVTNISIT